MLERPPRLPPTSKPPPAEKAERRELIDDARKAGVQLIVGHSHSFDTPVMKTRNLIQSGQFGRVRMITALTFTDFLYRPRALAGRSELTAVLIDGRSLAPGERVVFAPRGLRSELRAIVAAPGAQFFIEGNVLGRVSLARVYAN